MSLHRPADWLPRAVVAGFSATMVLLAVHLVGYAVVRLFALAPVIDSPTATASQRAMAGWLQALVYNQVTDPAQPALYAAVVLQIVLGMIGALVYASLFEPRLTGPGWIRGFLFALPTWFGTLVFLLPALGAGVLGTEIGAGPLPMYTTLVAHVAYGVVLGLTYAATEDIAFVTEGSVVARIGASGWRRSALGAGAGALCGAAMGLALGLFIPWHGQIVPHDIIRAGLILSFTLVGGGLGELIGSLSALPTELRHRPQE